MSNSLKIFKHDLTWEEKAQNNPLYAIMSDEMFEQSGGVPTTEQLNSFYARGVEIWNQQLESGFSLAEERFKGEKISVAEYGCGMGRTLAVPASKGHQVTGLDISATQLELFGKYFPYLNQAARVLIEPKKPVNVASNSVHFIYSFAVFQHIIHTSDVFFAFQELMRMLKPGGVLLIQVRSFNAYNNPGGHNYRALNFEKSSLVMYLKKLGVLPLPLIRSFTHTHWSGAGCYVPPDKYIQLAKKQGLKLFSVKFSVSQGLTWLEFVKPK
jgi:SAM-dependent methyltransferase